MLPKDISRRNFLKISGAVAAVGAMTGCIKFRDPYALPRDKPPVPGADSWYRGEERYIASSCGQCPVNCGINVRVVEGRAVKIDGNVHSPLVGGKLGPKGQTGMYTLYDPDRIKGPLKRDGERGSGRWKSITWDEAIGEVVTRLSEIRAKSGPQKLAVLCGRQRGFMRDLLERFCSAYGTPNFFDPLSTNEGALVQAMELMTGTPEIPGYDANHTSYILSLGSGIFEATCNGIHFARATGAYRRENPTRRSKIVQVEPNCSVSAKVADDWIQIKPGTYDVFALGLARELIKEGHYDRDFVENHTFGFDRFLKSIETYTPEKVEELTGVPAKKVRDLAWELSNSKPALVVVDTRSTSTSNGLEIARCALALNAILGTIERTGGLVTRKDLPLAIWPEVKMDAIAKAGIQQPSLDCQEHDGVPFANSAVDAFPGCISAGEPYSAEALLLYYSNPLFARNDPARFQKAFEKIPFIVSFSPFLDESAFNSDLILPDHTYLERWEDATPPPFGFLPAIGIRKPVVDPLYDTKHTGDVLIKIAKGLGGAIAEPFPWKNFKAAMEERLAGLYESKGGSITADDKDDFIKKLGKAAYWTGAPMPQEDWKTAFRTPSGKFEFYSQLAETKINRSASAKKQSADQFLIGIGKPGLQITCLPHAQAAHFEGAEADYPFLLMPYKDITYAEGSGANIPILKQLGGIQMGLRAVENWNSWVQLNSESATRLGVKFRDAVWVESPLGKIKAYALLSEKVPEGLVLMALGKGHTQFGRFAKGKGSNAKTLVAAYTDPLSGLTPGCVSRVRISKA